MPSESSDAPCPLCEGRGWTLESDGSAGTATACSCRATHASGERLAKAGIPRRYSGTTLENFESELSEGSDSLFKAKKLSQRYVESFLGPEGGFRQTGLLYVGPPGVGKTHLAVGVLRALIERYAVRGKFVDFTSLVHQIQSTFDPGSEESKRQVLDPVIDAEVLVLDELGAQRPTAFVNDMLYLVLNTRYTRCLPTIFTTNHPLEEPGRGSGDAGFDRPPTAKADPLTARIPARLVSRLYEMAETIDLPVEDFRKAIKSYQTHV